MNWKTFLGGLLALSLIIGGWNVGMATEVLYQIHYNSGKMAIVKQQGQVWNIELESQKFSFDSAPNQPLTFRLPDGSQADGKQNGNALSLRQGNNLFLEVKLTPAKIEIRPPDQDVFIWELKFKEDKIKVFKRGEILGEVKYYPEKGKLKAKNPAKEEVAVCKGLGRLSAALAPFLMDASMPLPQRSFLVLLFLSLGR